MPDRLLLLIGGGGHCRSCIDVVESSAGFAVAGIVEHPDRYRGGSVLGYPVIGSDNDLRSLKNKYDFALITIGQIGSSNIRQRLFSHLKDLGFVLPVIISSFAHVSKHAQLGEGSVVMHQAVVNAGAIIGENCILNTRCLVEHDTKIGDHTHISTAAVINGGVGVGAGSFVGSSATVAHGVSLPDNFFFKSGRLITSREDGSPLEDGIE